MKNPQKPPMKYICERCSFKCSNKKDYSRHISTAKHQNLINPNEKTPTVFSCICGKFYKHMSSLCSHRNSCYHYNSNNITSNIDTDNTSSNIVIELLRQNQEFKNLMIDQNKQMHETMEKLQQSQDQNVELQSKMVEIYKEGKTINNNNQKFNLNFFLNDTCKDAMSITDFLKTMNVNFDELEYIGNHGYVNGMTKMIMDRLKGMDVTKRPIHCTDIKRETVYIKDQDKWEKDENNKEKIKKTIRNIENKNLKMLPQWQEDNPDCMNMESKKSEEFMELSINALGGNDDKEVSEKKIMKNILKEVVLDKNNL